MLLLTIPYIRREEDAEEEEEEATTAEEVDVVEDTVDSSSMAGTPTQEGEGRGSERPSSI